MDSDTDSDLDSKPKRNIVLYRNYSQTLHRHRPNLDTDPSMLLYPFWDGYPYPDQDPRPAV